MVDIVGHASSLNLSRVGECLEISGIFHVPHAVAKLYRVLVRGGTPRLAADTHRAVPHHARFPGNLPRIIDNLRRRARLAGLGFMTRRRIVPGSARAVVGIAMMLEIAGCSAGSFLSQSGPNRADLVRRAHVVARPIGSDQELRYALVPLNQATVALMGNEEVLQNFPPSPTRQKSADGLIGIGDEVAITIFESGSGGLFLPRESGTRSGNFVTVPTQQVAKDGTISMPYAGTLRAAGTTPRGLSETIRQRLSNRALEPQVVVSVVDRRVGGVSVLGDVTSSTRFSLDPGGARVLEAIARAGGPRFAAFETMVTLQREGRTYRSLLSEIARNAGQNVQLQSNDALYVSHEPRYFLAMGAIGQGASIGPLDRRFTFNDDHISLIDALGRAGGLLDDRSNATGIFVYRMEPRGKIEALGVKTSPEVPTMVPTVFLLDLIDPAGYFYATRFAVHHEDVLYISNSPASDLTKFLDIIVPASNASAAIKSITQ